LYILAAGGVYRYQVLGYFNLFFVWENVLFYVISFYIAIFKTVNSTINHKYNI